MATVIGNVSIGNDCSVWPGAVIRGDLEPITIGERTNVQDNAVLHTSQPSPLNDAQPLSIGSEVVIGHSAVLHGCTVADNVLIGIHATILDGVDIPSWVMIAAGALVPPAKKLESGWLYVGNPCKALRPLKDNERQFLTWSPNRYSELKNHYLKTT